MICTVLFAWRLLHRQLIVALHAAIVRRGVDFLFFLLHPGDLLEGDNPSFQENCWMFPGTASDRHGQGRGKAIAHTPAVQTFASYER